MDSQTNRAPTRKPGDVISDTNHVRNYVQVDGRSAGSLLSLMIPSGGADEINAFVVESGAGGDSPRVFAEGEISVGLFATDPMERMMMTAIGAQLPSIQLTREQVQDLHDALGAILGGWPCTLPIAVGVTAFTHDCPSGINVPE